MSSTEVEIVARRLWERIGFLALSQPVVYEREIDLMKTAQRAQGRDTDLLDAKRKTLAQIAESEARDAVAMLEHSLLDQRQAGMYEERLRIETILTRGIKKCVPIGDLVCEIFPEQSEGAIEAAIAAVAKALDDRNDQHEREKFESGGNP